MRGYRVRLTGTWTRTNTTSADIRYMRDRLHDLNLRTGTLGCFVARRADPLHSDREGRFDITVFVPYGGYSSSWTDGWSQWVRPAPRTLVSRAKQTLRWFIADVSCRAPKLTFDGKLHPITFVELAEVE